ncbi:MAG TPA: peptide chain release factor N(5)-glutamine methyltransferase [Candidatus Saccharimonadales bacterium]|nr:peptide chain release factor N(5)-glutamine methyltransferase [Candidatus Saccharimonadales bacterium]
MATRGELRARGLQALRAAGVAAPALDADVLLAHVAGVGKEALVAHPEAVLPPDAERRYDELLSRRARGEPVAYLRGYKEFYGITLGVDPRVLVPRPETEVLVDAVRAFAAGRQLSVVDVGTGSGAIAIALARSEPALRILATDLSADALAVARDNAAANGVAARITFLQGDLLAPVAEPVDCVAANLPYLPADALDDLSGLSGLFGDRAALAFEPRLATLAGPDGLDLIRRAAADLRRVLRPGGAAFFECDPPQVAALVQLLAPIGPTSVIPDLTGGDRVVAVRP